MLRGTYGAPAEAAPSNAGIYIGVRGGWSVMRDTELEVGTARISDVTFLTPPATTTRVVRDFQASYSQAYRGAGTFSGFVGYDFGTFLDGLSARMEAEVGFLSHNVSRQTVRGIDRTTTTVTTGGVSATTIAQREIATAFGGGESTGRTSATYALANYYVDWNLGWVRPYVGAGLGFGYVEARDFGVLGAIALSDGNWGWAYQLGAGLSFDLTPNIALEAGVRQLGVRDLNVSSRSDRSDRLSVTSQQANVGVRVRF